jgi:DNA modification methylase
MDSSHRSSQLAVRYLTLQNLKPYPRNARTHSKHQIRQIANSIRAFGFTNPVLIDRDNQIVAGHGRVEAAKLLSMAEVPTILLENLSKDQLRAYMLADNKLADNAGWDRKILAIELQHLIAITDLDLDITLTGFEIPEIDLVIGESSQDEPERVGALPAKSDEPSVSQHGDIWQLGSHRILCGSSLKDVNFQSLFATERAAAVFTDPPYNVKIDGHATGNGEIRHREFAMASGEMSSEEFAIFLNSCLSLLVRYSLPQSVHYICMDWRHIDALLAAGAKKYDRLLNICVWVKDNGGMGSFYRSQHEFIAVFRHGPKFHLNNIQLGKFGRNRTNVWHYPGVQTMSKRGEEGNLLKLHPTIKPVKMIADALLDCTNRNDVVLDTFLGSGSTLLAAERIGRKCYGFEIDPRYVDTAIRRWQDCTGNVAINEVTRKSFDEVSDQGGRDSAAK